MASLYDIAQNFVGFTCMNAEVKNWRGVVSKVGARLPIFKTGGWVDKAPDCYTLCRRALVSHPQFLVPWQDAMDELHMKEKANDPMQRFCHHISQIQLFHYSTADEADIKLIVFIAFRGQRFSWRTIQFYYEVLLNWKFTSPLINIRSCYSRVDRFIRLSAVDRSQRLYGYCYAERSQKWWSWINIE